MALNILTKFMTGKQQGNQQETMPMPEAPQAPEVMDQGIPYSRHNVSNPYIATSKDERAKEAYRQGTTYTSVYANNNDVALKREDGTVLTSDELNNLKTKDGQPIVNLLPESFAGNVATAKTKGYIKVVDVGQGQPVVLNERTNTIEAVDANGETVTLTYNTYDNPDSFYSDRDNMTSQIVASYKRNLQQALPNASDALINGYVDQFENRIASNNPDGEVNQSLSNFRIKRLHERNSQEAMKFDVNVNTRANSRDIETADVILNTKSITGVDGDKFSPNEIMEELKGNEKIIAAELNNIDDRFTVSTKFFSGFQKDTGVFSSALNRGETEAPGDLSFTGDNPVVSDKPTVIVMGEFVSGKYNFDNPSDVVQFLNKTGFITSATAPDGASRAQFEKDAKEFFDENLLEDLNKHSQFFNNAYTEQGFKDFTAKYTEAFNKKANVILGLEQRKGNIVQTIFDTLPNLTRGIRDLDNSDGFFAGDDKIIEAFKKKDEENGQIPFDSPMELINYLIKHDGSSNGERMRVKINDLVRGQVISQEAANYLYDFTDMYQIRTFNIDNAMNAIKTSIGIKLEGESTMDIEPSQSNVIGQAPNTAFFTSIEFDKNTGTFKPYESGILVKDKEAMATRANVAYKAEQVYEVLQERMKLRYKGQAKNKFAEMLIAKPKSEVLNLLDISSEDYDTLGLADLTPDALVDYMNTVSIAKTRGPRVGPEFKKAREKAVKESDVTKGVSGILTKGSGLYKVAEGEKRKEQLEKDPRAKIPSGDIIRNFLKR